MSDSLKILVIEDNDADYRILERHLKQNAIGASYQRVDTIAALAAALAGDWDLVLADYMVPGMSFEEGYALVQDRFPDLPVIIVSGSLGEEKAVDLLKLGVNDFVLKDNLPRLVLAIKRCLQEVAEKRARRRAEAALRASEERFKLAMQGANDGLWDWNLLTNEVYYSPRWKSMLGYADHELTNRYDNWELLLHPDDRKPTLARLLDFLQGRAPKYEIEFRMRHKEGHDVYILSRGFLIFGNQGRPQRMVGTHVDITERMQAFTAIRQSEKSFRSLFDNMLSGFASCRMVYDETGRPVDFVYLNVNKAFAELTGLGDVVGKRATELMPGIRESNADLLETYGRVALIGRPERFETYVPPLGRWFSISVYSTTKGEFIAVFDNITGRKKAEESLRKLYTAVEQSPTAIVITDAQANVEYANPRFTQLTGFHIQEALGQNPRIIKGDTPDEVYRDLWSTISAGRVWEGDFHNRKKDGTLFWEHATIAPIRNEKGEITHYLAIKEDITERRSLEEQLRQSQKMEAVGTLAGGIAHDFNNILTAIIGYTTLLQMEFKLETKAKEFVDNIKALSDRAGNLTKSLLAFSRNQAMSPKLVNLNSIVSTISSLIGRLIGENIEIETQLAPAALMVMADRGHIEQMLMNLTTNARDAMPTGGKIILSTEVVNLESGNPLLVESNRSGAYALLSVSDTGIGMDQGTAARIFEPFFTTKEPGKGTGLGLSILYGILQQHQGIISVSSSPGQGTTFNIYFPILSGVEDAFCDNEAVPLPSGPETILIIEDDAATRTVLCQVLQRFGYRVIETTNGCEAVEVLKKQPREISLAIIDLIMPKMNGRDTYDALLSLRSDLKAIFTSGYPSDVIMLEGRLPNGAVFMAKPVSPMELLHCIRQQLDDTVTVSRGEG